MASPDQIAEGLLARCEGLSVGSPPLPIAMPEVGFTPPDDGKYLEVRLFYNRPAWEALAAGKLDQGLLQVTVVWPPRQGLIKPTAAAAVVMAHFVKGDRYGVAKITGEPWVASPLTEDSELRIPVSIPWTA